MLLNGTPKIHLPLGQESLLNDLMTILRLTGLKLYKKSNVNKHKFSTSLAIHLSIIRQL
jgi:hypothetical protein